MTAITFSPKQYNDLAGPLDKYVAANDNNPVDESGASAGFAVGWCATPANSIPKSNPFDRVVLPNGQYIGLTRPQSSDGGRHGDFMQTATGREFWPMSPRADEVFIEDIAHSLAMQIGEIWRRAA